MHTDRHWVLANMLPFNSFLTPSPNPEIAWKIAPATKEKATLRWRKGKRVLVIPGSRDESKRWDVDAFAKVINHLCEQTDVSTMVSGGPSDTALVSTLVGKVSGPCSRFTGRDLKMLLGLVQSADLVITNDTGPMHLAFLSQIPTIAVFTYMNPTVWGPIWDSPDFAVYNLSSISPAEDFVDEIRDKALSMLGKTRD